MCALLASMIPTQQVITMRGIRLSDIAMSNVKSPRIMREEQIPDFVRELTQIGCEIMAFGHRGYVFGDADMDCEVAKTKAYEIPRLMVKGTT
jgi:hypothetical protein